MIQDREILIEIREKFISRILLPPHIRKLMRGKIITNFKYNPYRKENFTISDSLLFYRNMVDDSKNVEEVTSITTP